MNEPDIYINGRQLTVGQAMTVRVAVSLMAQIDLSMGDDEHGKRMANGYTARLTEIIDLMMQENFGEDMGRTKEPLSE